MNPRPCEYGKDDLCQDILICGQKACYFPSHCLCARFSRDVRRTSPESGKGDLSNAKYFSDLKTLASDVANSISVRIRHASQVDRDAMKDIFSCQVTRASDCHVSQTERNVLSRVRDQGGPCTTGNGSGDTSSHAQIVVIGTHHSISRYQRNVSVCDGENSVTN